MREENLRMLQEMALSYGKRLRSGQTGYLHYCYHLTEPEPHLPIPVVENFLFALALLRSRTVDNVNEAKTLLEGLLAFQDCREGESSYGNFPIYLHEFPQCKDRFVGTHAAMAIFWILKQFHLVLGQELKKGLEESLQLAVRQALKTHVEKPAPYPIAIKIAALSMATGQLLADSHMETSGSQLLEELRANPDLLTWHCPAGLGNMLAALSLVYPDLGQSPWSHLWQHLADTWHAPTCTYAGPAVKEWQQGKEPQVTLYDLFLGYFSGTFSARALKECPAHLEAVLIPTCHAPWPEVQLPLELRGKPWHMCQDRLFAYSYVDGHTPVASNFEKGFQPLRLLWGDAARTHTLILPMHHHQQISFAKMPTGLEILFELKESIDCDDKEKSKEVGLFLDVPTKWQFLVAGEKASTFRLGEELTIVSDTLKFSLRFDLAGGEGKFLGHCMLGNRPSQLSTKGNHRFEAFDWQIFLRTLQRSDKCKIKISLTLLHNSPLSH